MSKSSICPLDPVDIGGYTPLADELITEETVGFIKTINLTSGALSATDPFREDYDKFVNYLGNASIIINNENIGFGSSDNYFDNIDLSNNILKYIKPIIVDSTIYNGNRLWANAQFGSVYMPPSFIESTKISGLTPVGSFKVDKTTTSFVYSTHDYECSSVSKQISLTK